MGIRVSMTYDLTHKTALITGASRGLGRHIAQYFYHHHANLILVARSQHQLEQLRHELLTHSTHSQEIKVISADLTELNSIYSLLNQIEPVFQTIDIIVNNAAIQGPIGPLWKNDWKEWQDTLQINLLTPIMLCRAILPAMIQRQSGKIINLSGGGATKSRPNFSAYAVAKTGLIRFSETLADEVKNFNIAVNCIAPGTMNTGMLKQVIQSGVETLPEPDDTVIQHAAELCAYFASSKSNGITGKLVSAIWDPWKKFEEYLAELKNSDIYTLRRIVPEDRGKNWSDLL